MGMKCLLFLLDADTHKEYARYTISSVSRPDVAGKYPNIPNAKTSGFSFSTSIPFAAKGRRIKIMTRYATDTAGNASASDCSFDKVMSVPGIRKHGNQESLVATEGDIISRGWHVTDNMREGFHRFIIIRDDQTGKELSRYMINNELRKDVAAKYPDYPLSEKSGYNINLPITLKERGKRIRLLSRFSRTTDGQESVSSLDYMTTVQVPSVRTKGNQEHLIIKDGQIRTRGWHLSDKVTSEAHSHLFIMNAETNKEISRHKIEREIREDVAEKYSDYSVAKKSGFNFQIPVDKIYQGKTIQIMSHYGPTTDGQNALSQLTFEKTMTISNGRGTGNQEFFFIKDGKICSRGWHVGDYVIKDLYRYIFLLDRKTGAEISRHLIDYETGLDVQEKYGDYPNPNISGFNIELNIEGKMKGKEVILMSRYARTEDGNNPVNDYKFDKVLTIPSAD